MKFSDIKTIIKSHIEAGDTRTMFLIAGSPGCGKSALGSEIGEDLQFDNVVDLNLSLLDTPDVAGLALIGEQGSDVLSFKKSPLLAPLQTGRNLLILDEFADAAMGMQNLGRRLLWNREINGLKLSEQTYIIGMSNRSIDKSGAGKLSGKVKNACSQLTMESNLDDFVSWALTKGNIDPVLIQFLRFKPDVLDMYNPDVDASPTPRQWELVSRVPLSLPQPLFFADVASKVGEGAAAEYASFRKIHDALVSFDDILLNPAGVKIPTDLSALYAVVGATSFNSNVNNVDRVGQFIERLPKDFGTMYWNDTVKRSPQTRTTKAFIRWATDPCNVLAS